MRGIVSEHFDGGIVILDEIDRLRPDESGNRDNILMQLSRAGESGKIDRDLGIVGISNKIDWGDELNQRVRSSLGNEGVHFPAIQRQPTPGDHGGTCRCV